MKGAGTMAAKSSAADVPSLVTVTNRGSVLEPPTATLPKAIVVVEAGAAGAKLGSKPVPASATCAEA